MTHEFVAASVVLFLLAGIPNPARPATFEPSADMPEIVRRSIELHGGDLFLRSEVRFRLCSMSGCTEVRSRRMDGLYEHEVAGQIRGAERRIVATNDRVELWTEGIGESIPPGDEQLWRDAATSRLYHAFLPFRLGDPSVRFSDLGTETWGDRTLHRVAVGFASGTSSADYDQCAFWFDPETARLEQFAYSYRGSPDGIRFRRLNNFRRVNGLLFADQENLGSEGSDLTVVDLDPESVAGLRKVSDVEFRDLQVVVLE